MRDIGKFRGLRTDGGGWAYGYLFKIWEQAYILWGTTNGVPNMVEVIPETVGEYTGKHDVNGKERLWEGDVIAMFQGTQRSEIFWDDEVAAWMVWAQLSGDTSVRKELLSNMISTSRKIGSIHDNRDLLSP